MIQLGPRRYVLLCALAVGLMGLAASSAAAVDSRAGYLIELAVAYGDRHFSSAHNLVPDPSGRLDIPTYSLPYTLALLETGLSVSRAKAVLEASLRNQDMASGSKTAGLFRRFASDQSAYSIGATADVIPLLVLAKTRYTTKLGDGLTRNIGDSLEAALKALKRAPQPEDSDAALRSTVALAVAAAAAGDSSYCVKAANQLQGWFQSLSGAGRAWRPSPTEDTQRIVSLLRLWEATPVGLRAQVERALELCYLDFAQRVHPGLTALAGAAADADPDEFIWAHGIANYLIYRDFGGNLPVNVRPYAAAIALLSFRPGPAITALVSPDFEPYLVQTGAAGKLVPAQTDTYVHPNYTLGSMTGWCLPETVPVFATFAQKQAQPTAYFTIQGAPAHISSFQYGNLAICSMNFDRLGTPNRLRGWVTGVLGSVHDIEEIYCLGTEWSGEPVAVGSRGTVVVKRGGVYLALTLLECGSVSDEEESRRKAGVMQWEGIGEHARLTITIYARQEEYALRRPADDFRAGFVVQAWDGSQFPTTQDCARWLARCKISHKTTVSQKRTAQPRDLHPVLDKHKPQPRTRYTSRRQTMHIIEYSYNRGKGDTFGMVEDVRNEEVLSRTRNGQAIESDFWWRSPGLTFLPGQKLDEALNPPPTPPTAPTPSAGAGPGPAAPEADEAGESEAEPGG